MVRMTATAAAAFLVGIGGAMAEEVASAIPWQAVDQTALATQSGGSDYFDVSRVAQGNVIDSDNTNHDNAISNSGPGARMENGAIGTTTLTGNSGIATAMQNTGNLVNMSYNMNVNVYLK